MHSRSTRRPEDLGDFLRRVHMPPRKHDAGINTEGAHDVLLNFAMDTISRIMNREMKALDPLMRAPQGEISEEKLCGIRLEQMVSSVSAAAPKTRALLRKVSFTPRQEKENKIKSPEPILLMSVAMLCYSRSHNLCKLQKMMTMYFRSCGLATKGFDFLNSIGICMNQRWVYAATEHLVAVAHASLKKDIATYPWFGSHDRACSLIRSRVPSESYPRDL
ncbi:uncharacterized protein C8Q71DRAFT_704368 [Rhodofomes roseus]|uniref:Transposase n=1 Tax=Rhodofomes roseus TaxID=34475 RepID=A0ABQ8KMN4_9APHY|nr:uncharacterized protein C8Q71DRAFT_704368 [Rhodofomes roseus]KAH9839550.1 hypothetical protein C8Q71DRAFT_704368 [Rhodofomes roseus]